MSDVIAPRTPDPRHIRRRVERAARRLGRGRRMGGRTETVTASRRLPIASDFDAAVFPGATDKPDLAFEDTNCDLIDGDLDKAIFVDGGSGQDALSGTRVFPKKTITNALAAAKAAGGKDVYVAAGAYPEALALEPNLGIYGGYTPSFSARSTQGVDHDLRRPAGGSGRQRRGRRPAVAHPSGQQTQGWAAGPLASVPSTVRRLRFSACTAEGRFGLALAPRAASATPGRARRQRRPREPQRRLRLRDRGIGLAGGTGPGFRGGGAGGSGGTAGGVNNGSLGGPRRGRKPGNARHGRPSGQRRRSQHAGRQRGPGRSGRHRSGPAPTVRHAMFTLDLAAAGGWTSSYRQHRIHWDRRVRWRRRWRRRRRGDTVRNPRHVAGAGGGAGGAGGGGGGGGGGGQPGSGGAGSFGVYIFNASVVARDSVLQGRHRRCRRPRRRGCGPAAPAVSAAPAAPVPDNCGTPGLHPNGGDGGPGGNGGVGGVGGAGSGGPGGPTTAVFRAGAGSSFSSAGAEPRIGRRRGRRRPRRREPGGSSGPPARAQRG